MCQTLHMNAVRDAVLFLVATVLGVAVVVGACLAAQAVADQSWAQSAAHSMD